VPEDEPAKKHEAALYELTLDFSQGKGTISKFLSSPILNQSLSVEDDNQILPDLIIFPDGNRVLSSNKKGGIRIADYSNGTVRENAALIPDGKIPLEPAAVNSNGTLIRCFTSFSNIYSFSSKTGQQQTIKKNESWRLLPDQSLFNQSMVCYDADSIWKIEFSRGKALLTNLKNKTFTLIYTGETGMADFQVVNNRFLFGMGTDGGLRAYSLETRQLLFTQYLFENGGNLILTPDGRMDANDEAKKLLYITMGMNVNTIENYTALDGSGFIQIAGLRKQLLR
jgi:WD40 repeat protein